MRNLLLSLFCLALGTVASAQSLDYITFQLADGSEKSLPVEGLKMTFEGDLLHATVQKQQVNFNLKDLAQMFFSATPMAIETVKHTEEAVAIVNGRLVVNAPADAEVQVYTLDGRQVTDEGLWHGVFLVKVNGRIYKLMAR